MRTLPFTKMRSACSPLAPFAVAATSWGLALFFTARRRMALPSIILVFAFVGGVLAATGLLEAQFLSGSLDALKDNEPMAKAIVSGLGADDLVPGARIDPGIPPPQGRLHGRRHGGGERESEGAHQWFLSVIPANARNASGSRAWSRKKIPWCSARAGSAAAALTSP